MENANISDKEEKGVKKEHLEKPSLEFESDHNLVGLFDILLQVGRRIEPEKYGNKIAKSCPQDELVLRARAVKYNYKI